jgi:hypothetical protein
LKSAWLTLTLMDSMTKNRKLSARRDSTGDGTTLSPLKISFRTWSTRKAYTITPNQLSRSQRSPNVTLNSSPMVRSTSSTNDPLAAINLTVKFINYHILLILFFLDFFPFFFFSPFESVYSCSTSSRQDSSQSRERYFWIQHSYSCT